MTKNQILNEFNQCSTLCFASNVFKEYILNNLSLLDTTSVQFSIQCINGAMIITNNTFITNQPMLINSYLSTILLENSTIYDFSSDFIIMTALSSNFTMNKVLVDNLHTETIGKFIQLSFGSHVDIRSLIYRSSSVKLIETLSSKLQLYNIEIYNINLTQYMIDCID